MKHFLSDEQRERTRGNLIVVLVGVAVFGLVYYFGNILGFFQSILTLLTPFLVGFALAFLLIPIQRRLAALLRKFPFLRKPKRQKTCLGISAFLCVLLLLVVVGAFLTILLPQLIDSVKSILEYLTQFARQNKEPISKLLAKYDFLKVDGTQFEIAWDNVLAKLTDYTSWLLTNIMAITNGVYQTVYTSLIGVIAAFYMMLEKDVFCRQLKKYCYSVLRKNTCEELIAWTRRAGSLFSGFIRGKILDSLIIGVICYVCMLIFNIEYSLLISVVVCVTNVIPFFGPFIGGMPSVLILLIVNPVSALWFGIFIIILQQIDGNIIGPMILGDSVGLSPFWIMFSIIIAGGLFGFAGMLLGVPVCALLLAIIKSRAEARLAKQNLPTQTSDYEAAPESLMDNPDSMPPRAVFPSTRQHTKKSKRK